MKLIDTHAHLTCPAILPILEEVLLRAQKAHVEGIVNICTGLPSLQEGLVLAKKHPWVGNAGATTPHDAAKEGESHFAHFEKAAKSGELLAIGETGLDYHYGQSPQEIQQQLLVRYLRLARECGLPLIFHCREAFRDLFAIAAQELPSNYPAVLHCFTGNLEEAKEAIRRGWMISLSGIITFKKSEALRAVVRQVPPEHLLIETDAPYLAPQSQRGKPNEPAFLMETAACLAALKEIPLEEFSHVLAENAKKEGISIFLE